MILNQGLIIIGQMILRNWCRLIKMQHGFQEKGDFSDNEKRKILMFTLKMIVMSMIKMMVLMVVMLSGATIQRGWQWFVRCRSGTQMIFGSRLLLRFYLKKRVLPGRNRWEMLKLAFFKLSLGTGWWGLCQSDIDSTRTFPDSNDNDRSNRGILHQSKRW